MTPDEARKITAKATELQAIQRREAAETARRIANQAEVYARNGAVKYLLDKVYEAIRVDASNALRSTVYDQNGGSKITVELVAQQLITDGYKVKLVTEHIPSYEGSNDDGFAYAHDACTHYKLMVTW